MGSAASDRAEHVWEAGGQQERQRSRLWTRQLQQSRAGSQDVPVKRARRGGPGPGPACRHAMPCMHGTDLLCRPGSGNRCHQGRTYPPTARCRHARKHALPWSDAIAPSIASGRPQVPRGPIAHIQREPCGRCTRGGVGRVGMVARSRWRVVLCHGPLHEHHIQAGAWAFVGRLARLPPRKTKPSRRPLSWCSRTATARATLRARVHRMFAHAASMQHLWPLFP